mmetsp:Transcript_29036/g.29414  ORF Transcript_29036/g.29414 Transcript_29036/m.29414 type:complete len:238 (+) Transcript_29036:512-1225(+)
MRETRRRNRIVIDHVIPSDNILHSRNSLRGRGVGEHHLAVGVPDAVHVGDDGGILVGDLDAHVVVNRDESAGGGDSGVFEAHVGRIRDSAGGYHGCVYLNGFHVFFGGSINHFNSNRFLPRNTRSNLTGKHIQSKINSSRLDQHPLGLLGNLPIKRRHEHRQRFDKGHLRPQRGVHVAEFQPDVAGSDDCYPFRHRFEFQRSIGCEYRFFVYRDSGGNERDGTRCQNDVFAVVHLAR